MRKVFLYLFLLVAIAAPSITATLAAWEVRAAAIAARQAVERISASLGAE